jgi:hypothetical protein
MSLPRRVASPPGGRHLQSVLGMAKGGSAVASNLVPLVI